MNSTRTSMIVVVLWGCASHSQVDPFEGYPTNCTESVIEQLGSGDVSTVLGFSAEDVALIMTVTATEPADIVDHSETLTVDLTTTAELASATVDVVDFAGDGSCLQGEYMRMNVRLVTTGQLNGYSVSAEDFAVVLASAATFDGVVLADDQDLTAGDTVTVAPELATYIQGLFQTDALAGDPATWVWSLGPSIVAHQSWSDATTRSKLGVATSGSGTDVTMTIARYVAVEVE